MSKILTYIFYGSCFIFLFSGLSVFAQFNESYKPQAVRVLILLDGSGSMKEAWAGSTRWEVAKDLLFKTVDSVQRQNPNVEFGIRIFGHQSPHRDKNCRDTRLEVPFAKFNSKQVKETLQRTQPQGWTPIAYTLQQAAGDFTVQPNIHNAIILITDGLETCGGDICAAGKALQEKRISLKPYVIGLGLKESEKSFFDCAGKFFDVVDAPQFKEVLNITISQSIHPTTAQINLLNAFGRPIETDVEITIYDHFSKVMLYNFVHALDSRNLPDTLHLDPKGKYDMVVHTIPHVRKNDIELTAGTHNIIPVQTPQGIIRITSDRRTSGVQALIKNHQTGATVYVQEVNTAMKYITGIYDVEILTLPTIVERNIDLGSGQEKNISIAQPGTLNITNALGGVGGVFIEKEGKLERVIEFKPLKAKESVQLQPGKYIFMFRQSNVFEAIFTKTIRFEIQSGINTNLRF